MDILKTDFLFYFFNVIRPENSPSHLFLYMIQVNGKTLISIVKVGILSQINGFLMKDVYAQGIGRHIILGKDT